MNGKIIVAASNPSENQKRYLTNDSLKTHEWVKQKWFISCCLRFKQLALICQTMNSV